MTTARTVALSVMLLTAPGCAHQGERVIADYMFSVAGVVKDATGRPVEGAQVTLDVSTTLYEAITPTRRQVRVTDSLGRFIVTLLTHDASNHYKLTFEKSGYIPQTVAAVSPPHLEHEIILARADAP